MAAIINTRESAISLAGYFRQSQWVAETTIPLDFLLDSIRATSQKNQNNRDRSNGDSKLGRIRVQDDDEELQIFSSCTILKKT
jgi:hypothetical protein